ncbi:hypothetical protein [Bifidobacterium vansinderenii]|nr:hypothetical protein [Bifidobacterium vansinderenii]
MATELVQQYLSHRFGLDSEDAQRRNFSKDEWRMIRMLLEQLIGM